MILKIKQGEIRGNREYTAWTRSEYFSFLGIPYAEPPIGDLRFKPPVKAKNWRGVFAATKISEQCYQTTFEKTSVRGSEDCLYINVFIPAEPDAENLKAVMVNVHGGGFSSFSGSPQTSSPDHLMDHDVILVTFNYRLHVLGFLNLGLPECPGNVGLKDQLMAFEWVKENIEFFGGDANNITLFGQSAGASSIHLHMMSPLSDGLFHKCILQSGSALSSWSFCDSPEERAFELGHLLGFRGDDRGKLLEFLKRTPTHDLNAANDTLRNLLKKRFPGKSTTYPFLPSVEKIQPGAILLDDPRTTLKNTRKIPTVIGMNDKEGGNMFVKEPKILEILTTQFDDVIRINENPDLDEDTANKIKKFYFPDGKIPADDKTSISNLYTDLYFKDFYLLEDYLLEDPAVPVYTYQFCYSGSVNFFKYFFSNYCANIDGAIHADDHFYIFGSEIFFKNPKFRFTADDVTVTTYMCSMWTNFAKTGNPNDANVPITWLPALLDKRRYLRIDKNLRLNDGRINEERYKFWDDLKINDKRVKNQNHQIRQRDNAL